MELIGAVSKTLELEVQSEVRRQGIVVWLDKDRSYLRFVDGLIARQGEGAFPFPVVAYRGSFLELMFQIEPCGNGLDRQPLLIHMPGFNEETIRKTPMLELYEAGVRFRKGLETLIREAATAHVAPAEVDKFIAQRPTLEAADAWLSSSVSESSFGLAALLEEFGPKLIGESLGQSGSSLAARVNTPEEAQVLRNYLHKLTGMDDTWKGSFVTKDAKPTMGAPKVLEPVLSDLGAWLLAVEYVHDLRRPPHLPRLAPVRGAR